MAKALNVLWASDGSEFSLSGAELIRSLILPVTSTVHVLTVASEQLTDGVGNRRKERSEVVERASVVTENCSALLPKSVQIETRTRSGHPVQEILLEAKRVKADLIVLGAKGHSDLRLMRMGSVAQGVLEYARRPVLMVRRSTRSIDTAIIGIDGSKTALGALQFFEGLAVNPGTVRVLARVVQMVARRPQFEVDDEHFSDVVTKINEAAKRGAQQDIAAALDVMPVKSRAAAFNEVFVGRPDDELLKAAAQWQADIVVVGSRVTSGARKCAIGSTAETIAREAISSVLVVR